MIDGVILNAPLPNQRLGADLVAVETSEENEFIKRVISTIEDTDGYWILGGKRIGNDYIWVQTGNRFGFTDWYPSYPDRFPYVYMFTSGGWFTSDSNWYKNFICEA